MALERGKLADVTRVAAGATSSIIAVASSKKVYVKSIIVHHPKLGTISTATAQVYVVPNGSTFSDQNKIFDIDIDSGETVLLEPNYPIVMDTTGDSLQVGTSGVAVGVAATHVNVFITGDKEA